MLIMVYPKDRPIPGTSDDQVSIVPLKEILLAKSNLICRTHVSGSYDNICRQAIK